MFKTLYLIILVVTTIVLGLALVPPLMQSIRAEEPNWNCTADSYSRLTCTISDLWIIYFLLAIFVFIGIIYYGGKKQEEDYGVDYGTQDYQYQ